MSSRDDNNVLDDINVSSIKTAILDLACFNRFIVRMQRCEQCEPYDI